MKRINLHVDASLSTVFKVGLMNLSSRGRDDGNLVVLSYDFFPIQRFMLSLYPFEAGEDNVTLFEFLRRGSSYVAPFVVCLHSFLNFPPKFIIDLNAEIQQILKINPRASIEKYVRRFAFSNRVHCVIITIHGYIQ